MEGAYPFEHQNYGAYQFEQQGHAAYSQNEHGGVGYVEGGGYEDYDGGDESGKSFGSSCAIMCFGCILFPLALCLLGWNEKNTVCQQNILMLVEDQALVGGCEDSASVEGKLTFYSCPIADSGLQAMTPLTSFNLPGLQESISFNTVAGAQKIEMYQCMETKSSEKVKPGTNTRTSLQEADERFVPVQANATRLSKAYADSKLEQGQRELVRSQRRRRTKQSSTDTVTTYRYRMGWSDVHYNSHDFKATPQNIQSSGCPDFVYNGQVNHNPAVPDRGDGNPAELGRQTVRATSVVAGAYTFSDEECLKVLDATERVSLTPFASAFTLAAGTDNIVTSINKNTMTVHPDSANYLSSCRTDRLGCIRISYNKSEATHISVIAKTGASGVMEPFPTEKTWNCPATNLIRMSPKEMTKEEMIAQMKAENDALTWGLRIAGLILAWLSLYCVFDPIATAADVMGDVLSYIPVIGEMLESALEGVVTMFLCLISCGFGCSCGLLVIAIVWVAMRPMIGGPLLGGVIVLFVVGYCALSKADRDPQKRRKGNFAEQQPLMGYQQPGFQQPGMMYA